MKSIQPFIRGTIARRLFLFNILIVFMPVAGFFSLSLYEDRLLSELENSMVQQGRIIAAWLQETPVTGDRAKSVIASLKQKHTARLRILDESGILLADSSDVLDTAEKTAAQQNATVPEVKATTGSRTEYAAAIVEPLKEKAETTVLYRVLSFPVRLARKYLVAPAPPLENADFYSGKTKLDGTEITRALGGYYGAITRISSGGQNSVTLYSAIPVIRDGHPDGAVLVSQSTFRILASLYEFRLAIGKIFIVSLIAAALVSLLLALTISRPLSRLKKEAESVIAGNGTGDREKPFHLTGRDDEIDRLSASLTTLVSDLNRQIRLSENFASDAAHEMKNRISGIRTAAELIAGGSADEANASVVLILENAGRMEKIISALRELSKIEAGCAMEGTADCGAVVRGVTDSMQHRYPSLSFRTSIADSIGKRSIPVTAEHLEIIAENLLENAASFSPPGSTVSVSLEEKAKQVILSVRDEGPGIPEEHRSRVFDRFFSWRAEDSTAHAGIGLSIVEAIMRKAGGSVTCANHPEGGAIFTLIFPAG